MEPVCATPAKTGSHKSHHFRGPDQIKKEEQVVTSRICRRSNGRFCSPPAKRSKTAAAVIAEKVKKAQDESISLQDRLENVERWEKYLAVNIPTCKKKLAECELEMDVLNGHVKTTQECRAITLAAQETNSAQLQALYCEMGKEVCGARVEKAQ